VERVFIVSTDLAMTGTTGRLTSVRSAHRSNLKSDRSARHSGKNEKACVRVLWNAVWRSENDSWGDAGGEGDTMLLRIQ
jgi:hypothetical protein